MYAKERLNLLEYLQTVIILAYLGSIVTIKLLMITL